MWNNKHLLAENDADELMLWSQVEGECHLFCPKHAFTRNQLHRVLHFVYRCKKDSALRIKMGSEYVPSAFLNSRIERVIAQLTDRIEWRLAESFDGIEHVKPVYLRGDRFVVSVLSLVTRKH